MAVNLPSSYNTGPPNKAQRVGPYRESATGNLFVFGFVSSGAVSAFKSTDGGSTWSAASAYNTSGSTNVLDTVFDSANGIVYALIDGGSGVMQIWEYTMSSDSWARFDSGTGPTEAVDVNAIRSAFLTIRSGPAFVVFYQSATETFMGSARRRVSYITCSSSGVWGTSTSVGGTGTTTHFDAKSAIAGASDRIHMLYTDSSPSLNHRSLSSANALDTPWTVYTLSSTTIPHFIFYDSTDGVVVAADPSGGVTWSAPSSASPTFSSFGSLNSYLGGDPFAWAFDSAAAVVYAFHRDSGNNDLDQDKHTGSTTFTLTTPEVAGAVNYISANQVGTNIGIVYLDTTTWKYTTIVLGGTPVSGTDVNGTTTESAAIATSSADTNATTTEAIGSRVVSAPDANGIDSEVAAISQSATDANGTTSESAAITVPISGTDANSATTENTAQTAQISNSDVSGTTTEVASNRLSATDSGGSATETATVTVQITVTDVNSAISEITSLVIRVADSNGATTEATSSVAQLTATDANGADSEAGAIRLSASDVNAGVSEAATISAPVSSSDANGTLTESAAIALTATDVNSTTTENGALAGQQVSSSDVNGAFTETASPRITTSDSGGAIEASAVASAQISASDADGTTTEVVSMVKSAIDTNGTTTEAGVDSSSQISGTDSNSVATESVSMSRQVTDTNTSVIEASTIGTLKTGTDTNGGASESASTAVSGLASSDAGTASESATEAVRTSSSDAGTASESATSQARLTVADSNGPTTEISTITYIPVSNDSGHGADVQLIGISVSDQGTATESATFNAAFVEADSNGTVTETTILFTSGTIQPGAPHWILSAVMDKAKLTGSFDKAELINVARSAAALLEVTEESPTSLSGITQPAILKRAVKSWRP